MIQFGIEPHVAVATNMMALIFMSAGGSLPFVRKGALNRKRLPLCVALTVVGSALGALLLVAVPLKALQPLIAIAMILVAVFTIAMPQTGTTPSEPTLAGILAGYGATLLLAVYGGFFSGGYVTLLTAAFVVCFGMTFLESVATTKAVNVFSSMVATLIFWWRGLLDLKLGVILGMTMFLGAMLGGHTAVKLRPVWLRRVFLTAVLCLAAKMLFAAA